MTITGFFYPRFSWGAGNTVDFSEPPLVIGPVVARVAGQNLAEDGTLEQLTQRLERRLRLAFQKLAAADVASLWTWYETWAALGKQTAITLDRLGTATANWEYSQWNTYFSKAELLNDPFGPQRPLFSRALYSLDLLFRQGQ